MWHSTLRVDRAFLPRPFSGLATRICPPSGLT